MSTDPYAHLTATILAQLETADPENWSPPWHGADPLPVNALTGRRYRGLNTLVLWATAADTGLRRSALGDLPAVGGTRRSSSEG